jgi:hypothetical protein
LNCTLFDSNRLGDDIQTIHNQTPHVMSTRITITLLLLGFGVTSYAQQTIPAAGGNSTGVGGTTSYTVGQVVYSTYASSNGSEAQGIQHPGISPLDCVSDTNNNGICDELDVAGCTYPLAPNYEATATMDDGSCTWPAPCDNSACVSDLDGDSAVGVSDLLVLLGAFGDFCEE